MTELRQRIPDLRAILILALILRGIWILLIPVDPISDSGAYDIFATNIAVNGVFGFVPEQPTAYWAVGTAAIYAFGYILFGAGSSIAVILPNLISSMVVVWLLHRLGRLYFDETVGRLAALLFAFWPLAIQYTTVLASEVHFMALTFGGVLAWERARLDRNGWIYIPVAGLCLAGATYVRPVALLIPAILAMATLMRTPRQGFAALVRAGLVTVIIFAAVTPWSMRNERVFGAPVFMSTNFWANFWMGNHPGTDGSYQALPPETDALTEIERSEFLKDLSIGYLEEDPAGFVWRTAWKAVRLHERETIGVVWNERSIVDRFGEVSLLPLKAISTGYWYIVLVAALIGIWLCIRKQGLWLTLLSPPVLIWGYITGLHAIIVIGDRYHMPAIPMIAILAAVAIRHAIDRTGRQTS